MMHPRKEELRPAAADSLARDDRAVVLTYVAECGPCREFLALITLEEGPPAQAMVMTTKKQRSRFARLLGLD
jgi:hypothetical protein